MIKFVEYKSINKKKWDDCINNSSNASIFVYSWYLDVVCKDWSALILGDYEAVFPLASKSKYKINYLVQPFFTRYFGLFSKSKTSAKMLAEFFDAIPSKFKFSEFCLHESNDVKLKQAELSEKKFQILDLKDANHFPRKFFLFA